jgi:hypothetical protein
MWRFEESCRPKSSLNSNYLWSEPATLWSSPKVTSRERLIKKELALKNMIAFADAKGKVVCIIKPHQKAKGTHV